jgi:3-dehydroquinate dehydratase-2
VSEAGHRGPTERGSADSGRGDRPLLVVLHGVNLGMLGSRPAAHYGTITLTELERMLEAEAEAAGWRCVCHQTDHEGEFVRLAHRYRHEADAVLVNPGAWTHYSYAIRDALELIEAPIAEVHLSDVENREPWRRVSVVADIATVRESGQGPESYIRAARALFESTRS